MNAKTEQAQHTPEPWEVSSTSTFGRTIYGPKGHGIARMDGGDNPVKNASRIVAAVNACEGIPTEALGNGVVEELLDAAKALIAVAPDQNILPIVHLQQAIAKAEGRP